jgi:hypothetical protein
MRAARAIILFDREPKPRGYGPSRRVRRQKLAQLRFDEMRACYMNAKVIYRSRRR